MTWVRCKDCGKGRPEAVPLDEALAWSKYHYAIAPTHHVLITEEPPEETPS